MLFFACEIKVSTAFLLARLVEPRTSAQTESRVLSSLQLRCYSLVHKLYRDRTQVDPRLQLLLIMVPIEETAVNCAKSITGLFVRALTLFNDDLLNHKLTGTLFQYVLDVPHLKLSPRC